MSILFGLVIKIEFGFDFVKSNDWFLVCTASSISYEPFLISSFAEMHSSGFIIKSSCYDTWSRYLLCK